MVEVEKLSTPKVQFLEKRCEIKNQNWKSMSSLHEKLYLFHPESKIQSNTLFAFGAQFQVLEFELERAKVSLNNNCFGTVCTDFAYC